MVLGALLLVALERPRGDEGFLSYGDMAPCPFERDTVVRTADGQLLLVQNGQSILLPADDVRGKSSSLQWHSGWVFSRDGESQYPLTHVCPLVQRPSLDSRGPVHIVNATGRTWTCTKGGGPLQMDAGSSLDPLQTVAFQMKETETGTLLVQFPTEIPIQVQNNLLTLQTTVPGTNPAMFRIEPQRGGYRLTVGDQWVVVYDTASDRLVLASANDPRTTTPELSTWFFQPAQFTHWAAVGDS